MKIGFLLDDYSAYQLLHAAPFAFALSRRYPEVDVQLIVGRRETAGMLRRLAQYYPGQRCRHVEAEVPRWVEWVDPLARLVTFARKPLLRRMNTDIFRELDMLVSSELSASRIKQAAGLDRLRLVYTHHGAGDRSATFNEKLRDFDLVFASGEAQKRRLLGERLVAPDRCAVVGYPKFELAGALSSGPPVFPESRPTVLYNPHFARGESSWQRFGRAVLETFRRQDRYNLIFAPHTRLYQRALRHGARPLGRYRACPHIHIDTGSDASIDMTYSNAADIYLGDVSSQIYEFLRKPRPCVFLDAHGVARWRDNPSYRYWRAGEVVRDLADLLPAIARVRENMDSYRPVQERLFDETFSETPIAASDRGADAIAEAAGLSRR